MEFIVISCAGERIIKCEYSAHWRSRCRQCHKTRIKFTAILRDHQPQQAYWMRIKQKVSKRLLALIWNIYCMLYFLSCINIRFCFNSMFSNKLSRIMRANNFHFHHLMTWVFKEYSLSNCLCQYLFRFGYIRPWIWKNIHFLSCQNCWTRASLWDLFVRKMVWMWQHCRARTSNRWKGNI